MNLTDILGKPMGPRHLAISMGLGVVAGVGIGFLVDRLSSKADIPEDEVVPGWREDDFFPEDVHTVSDLGEYSDFSLPDTFLKPDISDLVDYAKYFDGEAGKDADDHGDSDFIRIITEEEFLKGTGNEDGYISVVGTWFPEDGVLAGWNEDLAKKDVSKTIGIEAVELLREEDAKAVYVSNEKEKVLYEIVKGIGSFEDAVHPVPDLE